MSRKIVFLDIDGTILDHDGKIPASTKLAVKKLKKNNVHVAIATGRPPNFLYEIRKELEIDCYVSCNGSYVVHDGEVIFKRPLEVECLDKLTAFAKENNHLMCYFGAEKEATSGENQYVKAALDSVFIKLPEVDVEFHLNNEVYQALVFYNGVEEALYKDNFPSFDYHQWHEYAMDVMPKSSSKAVGILEMVERMGYDIKDAYAFGDGLNDVEMLREVGTGIAMGNASDYVKGCADFVTKDVGDDGIYYGLKHFNLI